MSRKNFLHTFTRTRIHKAKDRRIKIIQNARRRKLAETWKLDAAGVKNSVFLIDSYFFSSQKGRDRKRAFFCTPELFQVSCQVLLVQPDEDRVPHDPCEEEGEEGEQGAPPNHPLPGADAKVAENDDSQEETLKKRANNV